MPVHLLIGLLVFVVIAGHFFGVTCLLQDDSIVNLPNGDGMIHGLVDKRWRSFRGIPFAKPPLGQLRFLPPEKNDAWSPNILDATNFQPNCAQAYTRYEPDWDGFNLTIDEDCLYLNVFTPGKRAAERSGKVPVGFFIYGGGHYAGGANDEQLYAWHTAAEADMIFVTHNYRLGAFGWLGSEELRVLAKDGSMGNAGFLDQRLALKWTRDNIEAFGGDTSRILLFGESSGAADVSSHMVSPGSQGLFSRAMMQSGGFTSWSYIEAYKKQTNFDYVLNITGCNVSRPFAVQCLQAMPWWTLSKIMDKAYTDFPYADGWKNSSFAATIDGVVLLDKTDKLAMEGKVAGVPVLIGCNDNEGSAFLSKTRTSQDYTPMTMTEKRYKAWVETNFPEPWAGRFFRRYNLTDYTPFFTASHVVGDYVIRCPTHRAMQYLTMPRSMDHKPVVEPAVFGYVYTHDPVGKLLHSGDPCTIGSEGAFHGAEIPFFLDIRAFFSTTHERRLASQMATYLRNFAWSGDPNKAPSYVRSGISSPAWPVFLNTTKITMQLGAPPDGNISSMGSRLAEECKVMDAYFNAGQPGPPPNLLGVRRPLHKVSARSPNLTDIIVSLPNGDGQIRGHGTERWRSFRGIPFAKPPIGPRRFLPPVKNDPWHPKVLDALNFKYNCLQSNYIKSWQANAPDFNDTVLSEDCLYLNVFAPGPPRNASRQKRRFPVVVHIYDFGGASDDSLDFWKAAAAAKMIFVTFNYRLGVFGFLGGRELRQFSTDGSTGNAGLLDQRLVLQWVQDNIEAFHGDPQRVLLVGGNSAAAHVSSHMVALGSKGLFQRAMMSSGAFREGGQQSLSVSQANFDFIAEKTGCRATNRFVVQCLQSLSANVLQDFLAYHPADRGYEGPLPFPSGWSNDTWTATIDGVTLLNHAQVLARQAKVANIPVILGSSHNAGTSVATKTRTSKHYIAMTMGERAYEEWVYENFPHPWAPEILRLYSVDNFKPFWAAAAALTDLVFKCPTQRASRFLSRPNGPDVFEYNFVINPVGPRLRPDQWGYQGTPCTPGSQGVAVGYDLMFFLQWQGGQATTFEKDTSARLLQYVRNFAWSGDPNVFPPWVPKRRRLSSTLWPAYSNRTHTKLWIGPPSQGNITVQDGNLGLSCDLWNEYWVAGQPVLGESPSSPASATSEYMFV